MPLGLRRFFNEWVENLGGRIEAECILEGDGRVVSILRVIAAGSASGAPVTIRIGQVISFRDGLISSVDGYYEASEALAAVGLSVRDVCELHLVRQGLTRRENEPGLEDKDADDDADDGDPLNCADAVAFQLVFLALIPEAS
jgi:hypothetical protein